MHNHKFLWASTGLLLTIASFAFADDIQQDTESLLPQVSLVTQVSPLPALPTVGVSGSTVPCGGPGATGKGCSAAAPAEPLYRRRPVKTQADRPKTSSILTSNSDQESPSHSTKLEPGMTLDPPVVVLPEATTTVKLSASDLNRIICPTDVKEALTSDEKGLMIKITGKDVFVKYKVIKRSDGKLSYSNTPTELFVVCGGSTYTMIAYPGRVPSQTIKLSSGIEDKIKENQSLYAGIPFEKRLLRSIKEVYTDNIPESYSVVNQRVVDTSWKSLIVVSRRVVDIEGEGIRVKEYQISLKPGHGKVFKLSEKMFLRKDFAINPVAVSIDKHILRPGEVSRLFIVEQRADKPLGGNGLVLPTLEDGSSVAPQASAKTPASTPSIMPKSSAMGKPGASQPQRTYMMN